jgi:hypothetical protein
MFRVGTVEQAAIKTLKEKIYANKSLLLEEFLKHDPSSSGLLQDVDLIITVFTFTQLYETLNFACKILTQNDFCVWC